VEAKTHFRKAFDSPYLSSADIVGPTVLTIARVTLEVDRTKKTKDLFNTAHFVERELRPGEPLKPMILNATNSNTLKKMTGTPFIEDWQNVRVTIYVDHNVKFGRDVTEGLRINPKAPSVATISPATVKAWQNAKAAYMRDGNLDAVLARAFISEADQQQLIGECRA
jgi:hypothetical protein